VHDGQDGGEDGLGGAGGDGDLGVGVVTVAVDGLDLFRDGLAQRGHAGHGRVLVEAALHGLRDRVDQARVALEIREALAQVDGAFFGGQGGHDGEDGGADLGQAADELRGTGGGHGAYFRAGALNFRSGCACRSPAALRITDCP